MKKIFIIFALLITTIIPASAVTDTKAEKGTELKKQPVNIDMSKIGFHKRLDVDPQLQMKQMFKNYQNFRSCCLTI